MLLWSVSGRQVIDFKKRFGNPTGCERTTRSPTEAVLNYLPAGIHLYSTTIFSWSFPSSILYYAKDPWSFIFILYHKVYTSIMSIKVTDVCEFNCNLTSCRVVHAHTCAFHALGLPFILETQRSTYSWLFVYVYFWLVKTGLSQARKARERLSYRQTAAIWELISSFWFLISHSLVSTHAYYMRPHLLFMLSYTRKLLCRCIVLVYEGEASCHNTLIAVKVKGLTYHQVRKEQTQPY